MRKKDNMTALTHAHSFYAKLAQSKAQLSIYENELRSSVKGSDYYVAVMSLYNDEIQTYGSLKFTGFLGNSVRTTSRLTAIENTENQHA